MMLLRLISWPYLRKHLLRSVLTTCGIVLGVALLVGMQTANQSVLRAFSDTVDKIAGKAQLQVTSGDSGFLEEVLERVQSVKEVRAAAPVIESAADPGFSGQGKLLILAVDMTGDRALRDYDMDAAEEEVIDDPLIFLAQPDSLIVTREFAARNGLSSGSRLTLDTMEGRKQFTIRGILKAGGMASAFGGNLAIMDIYAAQKVFGRGRRFDRIDIGLQEGVTLDAGIAAIEKAVGPGFRVEPPSGRGKQFESLLGVYTVAIGISSVFALFIGMFIIYNSFSIAVTQRRSEIGILRALGATRAQIRTLFLAESAIAGAIGSAAGVALGLAFARSLTGITGQMMDSVFGVPQNAKEVHLNPWFLAGAAAAGIVTSMLAALIPARNASRVEPVQALQKGKYQVIGAGENRARRIAAAVACATALLCLPFAAWRPAFYAGYIMAVLAALLLTPFLSLELARLLRYPLRWIRPVEGSLAADSLIQAPRRTSATVAALMLSLAMVVGQGGIAVSSLRSIEDWVTHTLDPDLFVSASETLAARDFHFPPQLRQELERLPGVREVQPVRTIRVQYRNKPVMIVGVDTAHMQHHALRNLAGDDETMYRLTGQGKGVLIAESLSRMEKLRMGDIVDLATPAGPLRLPVVGIVRDFSNQLGSIFLDRQVFVRQYQDDTVDIFRVYLQPGADPEAARRLINQRLGAQRRLFVILNKEARDFVMNLSNQWLGMTRIQVLVAVLVAVLGIVNTLTVSIADRRRELGVLRAVGGLRRQIRQTVWLEAIAIGVIGLLLGFAVGAANLYYELQAIEHDLTGMVLGYEFPLGVVASLTPVILGAAFASALLPAETAVRSSLVEALEYE
jgi:putative ABC transport system permease protein